MATWGPGAWDALGRWCDRARPALTDAGAEIWFRPRASHVLSDAQRCLAFLRAHEGEPFAILLDPLGMLTQSMRPLAEDHLERMLAALAEHPGVRALIADPGDPAAETLAGIVERLWPSERPIVRAEGHPAGARGRQIGLHADAILPPQPDEPAQEP